jgi:hypothetical protein
MGYTKRDNAFYTGWDVISRDRDTFARWIDAFVLSHNGPEGYLAALEDESLLDVVLSG